MSESVAQQALANIPSTSTRAIPPNTQSSRTDKEGERALLADEVEVLENGPVPEDDMVPMSPPLE